MAKEIVLPSSEGKQPQNMEDVLEEIGGFGKFQILILVFILSMEIPTAFLVFVPVFIGAAPDDWLCDGELISKSEACTCAGNLTAVDPTATVVAEWNLICGSSWVSDAIISFQFSGMLFGNIFISQLSDWYGRRYCFLGIVSLMALGTVVTASAPNYYVYGAARFICGAAFSGFLSVNAVYSMEFLTPNWRPMASSAGPFGQGIMLLGLLAYYIRPWRTLVWATALPFTAIIFMFPFTPESPRWLLRNRKLTECHKVLGYMARINRKENIDIETLRYLMEQESPSKDTGAGAIIGEQNTKDVESSKVKRFSYLEFYRNPNLRKTTLCLQGLWFSWGVVYFGSGVNVKNMAGSPYLNMIYVGLMDAIGYPSALLITNKLGRRKSLVVFMTLCAAFLVAIAVLLLTLDLAESYPLLLVVLTFIGRYFISAARCALRTLTGESFPTALRVMGIGFAASAASIGAALAPQFVFLGSYWPSTPYFGFAVIGVCGSLVSFLLRETTGQPLVEDMKGKEKIQTMKQEEREDGSRRLSIYTIVPDAKQQAMTAAETNLIKNLSTDSNLK